MNKEIPILFSTEMVKAILEGKKNVTRRIISSQFNEYGHVEYSLATIVHDPELCDPDSDEITPKQYFGLFCEFDKGEWCVKCPYGKIGDTLWVRETTWIRGKWIKNGKSKSGKDKWKFIDKTISGLYYYETDNTKVLEKPAQKSGKIGWYKRPAIFSPRSASRLLLEITNIRIDRLKDITEEDAKAEGVNKEQADAESSAKYKTGFYNIWLSINGEESWNENPWVWVIEFKKNNYGQ